MKSKLAILASLLALGAATPAFAAWDAIGSVDVDGGRDMRGPAMGMRGMDRDVKNFDLGGPVERLQLRADRSDITCRSVNARYGNGRDRSIFHGRLSQGRTVDVDVPDGRINALTFNCAAMDRSGGTIRISADVGRYRNDWMHGPNWQATWSRMFNWGSQGANNWQLVGTESFEGRNDSENSFTGWRGRNVESVALKPLDADARCSRVVAHFGNGREQPLNLDNGGNLRRGMFYKLDLPGRSRDLNSISLRCRATDARKVTMQIFTGR